MALPDLPETDAPPGEAHCEPDLLAPHHSHEEFHAAAGEPTGGREEIDTRMVRRLADILKDTDLSEIEVERGELKIRVARQAAVAPAPALVAAPAMLAAPVPQAVAPSPPASPAAEPQGETMRGEQVKSPMVGTVYLQPNPGAKRFVSAGEQVTAGQTLLIVEAMKTMNPVPAPKAGTVIKVLVEDG